MADSFIPGSKSQKFPRLKAEILREFKDIERCHVELNELLGKLEDKEKSTFDLRAIGSILHDFYCGIERIFERIAKELNGGVPEGTNWHRQLLRDMTLDIKGVRPPVISEELEKMLSEYLRFRHVFRNIYGFSLEWRFMEGLVERLPFILNTLKKEIEAFCAFLENISHSL
ncbi:MAG: hypothetical protein ACK41Q_03700 [Candidatus Brocadia sp.]